MVSIPKLVLFQIDLYQIRKIHALSSVKIKLKSKSHQIQRLELIYSQPNRLCKSRSIQTPRTTKTKIKLMRLAAQPIKDLGAILLQERFSRKYLTKRQYMNKKLITRVFLVSRCVQQGDFFLEGIKEACMPTGVGEGVKCANILHLLQERLFGSARDPLYTTDSTWQVTFSLDALVLLKFVLQLRAKLNNAH